MEENNNENMNSADRPVGYNNRWNRFHSHGHFMLIRLILGLIILAVVFLIGLKIGEFKGEFGGNGFRGGYEMRGPRGGRGGFGRTVPMYRGQGMPAQGGAAGNSGTQIAPQNTNSTPPTTTK